ncbi:COG3014 family protein [Carboxylicivirga sp. RSCT41]|uniref:COG3014 family protein n=1 Tax=Carboxylicivirga agarovorans TaxID=3417570 RepID=UPI003D344A75
MKTKVLAILLLFTLLGCATYYEQNIKLQNLITSGQFEAADKVLANDNKGAEGKNRFLYFCNRGVVCFMNGQYELSNSYFNKADYYAEDFSKSFGNEALALVTNPMVKPYRPEDFESVLVHFYKALNYIYLKDYEGALVECRRVNIVLQQLNDKYKKNKNKYSRDAFAHCMMGLIYEAAGNANDAFIAYRNALEIYEEDYKELFGLDVPEQLKNDLMRTAHQLGFGSELDFYENKFGYTYEPEDPDKGHLVFFWLNGFGPVKDEWSINFTNTGYNDGWVTLANEEHGLTFPIYIGNKSSSDQAAFKNMSFLRVAFPKYSERKPIFTQAHIAANGERYLIEMGENVNAVAFQCLNDRMVREMAAGIARLATKKALEEVARNENENLGTIVSIVNAMTEKADTRNWQSLPYSISYCRVPLDEGMNSVQLNTSGRMENSVPFNFEIKKNQTTFFAFHNLESDQR